MFCILFALAKSEMTPVVVLLSLILRSRCLPVGRRAGGSLLLASDVSGGGGSGGRGGEIGCIVKT